MGGGLRNWGPTHLTCKLSICWGGTDLGTHAHWGATVPPNISLYRQPRQYLTPPAWELNKLRFPAYHNKNKDRKVRIDKIMGPTKKISGFYM